MKSLKIALAVLVGALAAGCYNDFDTPAPRKIYTDTDMTALGLEHVTIKAVKDYFGNTSGTGENDEWSDTQTVKFGELTPEEKAAVSHRGKALAVFEGKLKDYLKNQKEGGHGADQ